MKFMPLGDQAVLAYCDDEAAALDFAAGVRELRAPWIVDVVQAYQSVAVFYALDAIEYREAARHLEKVSTSTQTQTESKLVTIPVCYELGLDLDRIAKHTSLSVEDVICLHSSTTYTVYAIGFCPGFPYLGYLPDSLTGVPRLESPRLRVEAGSVGLTGRQTGIYTEARPGGWNIVGRTPLELVNVAEGYFPLRTGDQVRFEKITEREFAELKGKRL